MTTTFDFTVLEPRSYTIELEACNASYTGTITAVARPVYSRNWNFPNGVRLREYEPLYQYSTEDPNAGPTGNSFAVPEVSLAVVASGKSISVAVPFGAGPNPTFLEYMSGQIPSRYLLTVKHNGTAVLSGVIDVNITGSVGGQQPAGFSICNAKII